MARVTVLFGDGPYGSARGLDALDATLAAIAFEHEVSALFIGAGVALLRTGQDPAALGAKRWTDALRALPVYGIARVGADAAALARHGLDRGALLLAAEPLDDAAMARWIAESEVVLGG